MIRRSFLNEDLPLLGFGAMRLPTDKDGKVDEAAVFEMVDFAMANGVNYFDTAYPYHGGKSEIIIGKALSRYPRESYFLADKYPGHQVLSSYDPSAIFEEQLKRCGVEYFDFYLLHNVYEHSVATYVDERWGILDYFVKQKKEGRIRHLGFSTHAHMECLKDFVNNYGDSLDFCQIQFNYLDDTLQRAGEKYDFLTSKGLPVIVMEPLRGGKLASLNNSASSLLGEDTPASYAFRFLMEKENIAVILSGMSNMAQLKENVRIFDSARPLTESERTALSTIAEGMKSSVPCTRCGYCTAGCPMGLDIPLYLNIYNELRVLKNVQTALPIEFAPQDKKPSACISCGKCTRTCPQKIDIPKALRELVGIVDSMPKWADICREREEAARKCKQN